MYMKVIVGIGIAIAIAAALAFLRYISSIYNEAERGSDAAWYS